MTISRRKFIQVSTAAGVLCSMGIQASAPANGKWKDVVAWDHSWDALDAITYEDDGKDWGVSPSVRVRAVPDSIGGLDLTLEQADDLKKLVGGAIPGPLFQSPNGMFGDRPSWYSDTISPHDPDNLKYWYSLHSALFTGYPTDGSARKFLEWEQPWWGSVLVRGVGPFEGHNQALIDGNPGMVTISRSPQGTVMVRSWPEGMKMGPAINSGAPYEENTALVLWHANGDKSWLEVNYRDEDGVLITKRVEGAVGGRQFDDFHSGFTHTNRTSCIGIARGVPSASQTDAVRSWAVPYIPAMEPASEVAKES